MVLSENECGAGGSAAPNSCQLQSLPKVWIMFVSYIRPIHWILAFYVWARTFGELPPNAVQILIYGVSNVQKMYKHFYCFANKNSRVKHIVLFILLIQSLELKFNYFFYFVFLFNWKNAWAHRCQSNAHYRPSSIRSHKIFIIYRIWWKQLLLPK